MAQFITARDALVVKGYGFISINIDLCTHIEGYFSANVGKYVIHFQPSDTVWGFDLEDERDDIFRSIMEKVGF